MPGGRSALARPALPGAREAGRRLCPGALPLYTGELGLRLSGELLLLLPPPLSGERRCLPFTLPGSAAPPPTANGGVALGGGGLPPPRPPPPPPRPVLLPTEAEGDRVGLCWLPRRSWYGTVARMGWSSRLVPAAPPPAPLPGPPAVPPPAVGDPAAPRLILCGGGWWWDGGVCEELDEEDMAGIRGTRRVTHSGGCGGTELGPRHPACTGRGGRRRRKGGGRREEAGQDGTSASRPKGVSAPPAQLPPALPIGDGGCSHARLRPSLPAPASWAPGALPSPAAAHIVQRCRLGEVGGGAR